MNKNPNIKQEDVIRCDFCNKDCKQIHTKCYPNTAEFQGGCYLVPGHEYHYEICAEHGHIPQGRKA